jgi:hypothetical protein
MSYLTQVLFFVHMRGADNAANVYPGPNPIGAGNFQELISPQAQMQFAVIFVCFTPESGHVQCIRRCLLWARSGHLARLSGVILWSGAADFSSVRSKAILSRRVASKHARHRATLMGRRFA